MSLTEKGRRVAELRQLREQASALLAELEAELAKTPLGKRVNLERHALDGIKVELAKAEGEFKDALLADYRKRQVKKPVLGGEIKVYKRYDFRPGEMREWLQVNAPAYLRVRPDDETVRAWAIENAPGAVEMDEKAIDKAGDALVKMGAPIEVHEDPRPQITKDVLDLLADTVTTELDA